MTNEWTDLTASDGFTLKAWTSRPERKTSAGVVVLQEIFGVNHHIRSVTTRWAVQGYLAIAPALFERAQPDVELEYNADGMSKGQQVRREIPLEKTLLDVQAAIDWLRSQGMKTIGVVGYCWGGTLAWFANTRLQHVDATSSYYGGLIAEAASETRTAPAIFHFGTQDRHIGVDQRIAIRIADIGPVYEYDADHGFNCDERTAYNRAAAELALERTLALFDRELHVA